MKNKYFIYILIFMALLFFASVFASADSDFYVNDEFSVLPKHFDSVYAIGTGGTDILFSDSVYALTASGLQRLGSATVSGGGGLIENDEPIMLHSDRVKVGLAYTFTPGRDCSVSSAVLENTNGGGFSFGYYDDYYQDFVVLDQTDAGKLIFRPGEDQSVDVFLPDEDTPVYTLEATSKDNYLYVRAEPYEDEPLIRYAGIEYFGDFCFAALQKDRLTVVNYVDLERYVMGVCAIEMTDSWPIEALKAQAVAARTFVQRMIGTSAYYNSCGFDVTADTYTQAYRGTRGVGNNVRRAVNSTQNEYLTKNGVLIDAVYSASDGGATEDSENIFGYQNDYLVGVFDPYEEAAEIENPYSSWTVTMTPAQLGNMLGIGPVQSVSATTSRMGNVIRLEIRSTSGEVVVLLRDNCRTRLGLNSIRYTVSKDSRGFFVFKGSGCGHSLGMSQWGAFAMARYYDKDYRFILGFYYTEVSLSYGELPPKPERPPEEEPEDLPEDEPDQDPDDDSDGLTDEDPDALSTYVVFNELDVYRNEKNRFLF